MRILPFVVHAPLILHVLVAWPAGVCMAQGGFLTDTIGIFFDEAGCYVCGDWQEYSMRSAYLIIRGTTAEGDIAGWECSMVTSPSTLPAGFTLEIAGNGVNLATWPDIRVLLPTALPRASTVRLATFSTFHVGGPLLFGIGPAHPSSLPDSPAPAYFALPDVTTPRPLQVLSMQPMPGVPGASLVADATSSTGSCEGGSLPEWWCDVVPARDGTWGAVKSLYGR